MITAILFDLDDTLLDHTTAIEQAVVALLNRVAPGTSASERTQFVARWKDLNRNWYQKFYARHATFLESGRGKLWDAFAPFGRRFDDSEADALLAEYYEEYVMACRPFDDVIPFLSRLGTFKLGVVTNGQEEQQLRKVKRCGLDPWLKFVVTSEAAGSAKPDLQIFSHACTRLGVREDEAAYVGDGLEIDAIPASRAGLTAIWLNRRRNAVADCPPEIRQLQDLTGLVECLLL
jgi:putative hydrolase of the HAD superfamily